MGTVKMGVVLTVVTILNCHLSLGQAEMSGDTLHSLGQDEASEDIQLLEPSPSPSPVYDRFFADTYFDVMVGTQDWQSCGAICSTTPACKFWSWAIIHGEGCDCFLIDSDHHDWMNIEGAISGAKG